MTICLSDLPKPASGRTGWPWTVEPDPLPLTLSDGKLWPRITVVTPSYCQDQYLEETIRSVLLQGYSNLEYIIIDGDSPDSSSAIIQSYAAYISFWVSEPDAGQANAINKGFARSTGEIMGWLNSDDILLPDALRQIAESFVADPSIMVVTGFRKVYNKQSQFYFNFIRDLPTNYYIRHYCNVAQETTYWRRSVWKQLGPLDESFHFAMDYDYWLRMIDRGYSLHLIRGYIGGFRWYAENKTTSKRQVYQHDIEMIYKRYKMGPNEAEILAQLGSQWKERYPLLTDLGFKSLSDNARLVSVILNLLENRTICSIVLAFYKRYRQFRPKIRYSEPVSARTAMVLTLLTTPPLLLRRHLRQFLQKR